MTSTLAPNSDEKQEEVKFAAAYTIENTKLATKNIYQNLYRNSITKQKKGKEANPAIQGIKKSNYNNNAKG